MSDSDQNVADSKDSLPIGEDDWSKKERVLLLNRALLYYRNEWLKSIRSGGNEVSSNAPTFGGAVINPDPGIVIAAGFGLAITCVIGYAGRSDYKDFIRILQIWSEFQYNKKNIPEEALEVLSGQMHKEGLLFAGIPPKETLGKYEFEIFKKIAIAMGFFEDGGGFKPIDQHVPRHKISAIPKRANRSDIWFNAAHWLYNDSFSGTVKITAKTTAKGVSKLQRGWASAVKFGLGQVEDGLTNWSKVEIWASIGGGFLYSFKLGRDFKILKNQSRDHIRIKPKTSELPAVRIEENKAAQDLVDKALLQEVAATRADFQSNLAKAKVLALTFSLETGFLAAHVVNIKNALERQGAPDLMSAGISSGSLLLVLGAYAYLGHEIKAVYKIIQSNRARMLKLYPEIEGQYHNRKNGNGNGETDATQKVSEPLPERPAPNAP